MKPIVYSRTAARELRRLGQVEALRIRAKIAQLADDPASVAGSVARLKRADAQRLRVGDWRVVFTMQPDRLLILKIAHRREVYE
jgi:mRNA interferase RelE/StbE